MAARATSSPQWCVYIVESESGALYTGITTDVERRFEEHRLGRGARFFRLSPARRVVFCEAQTSHSCALKREREIKRLTRRRKLELIGDQRRRASRSRRS